MLKKNQNFSIFTMYFLLNQIYLQNIDKKIKKDLEKLEEYIEIIDPYTDLLKPKLKQEILKKQKEKEESKAINSSIPSTEFIKKIFDNKDLYFHKHQELERELSPHRASDLGIK